MTVASSYSAVIATRNGKVWWCGASKSSDWIGTLAHGFSHVHLNRYTLPPNLLVLPLLPVQATAQRLFGGSCS